MKIETHVKVSGLLLTFERQATLDIGLLGFLLAPFSRLAEADRIDRENGRAHDFAKTPAAQDVS